MMPSMLAVGIVLASFLVLGYAVLSFAGHGLHLRWFERAAMAWVLGAGAASAIWVLCIPVYAAVDPRWVLALATVAGLAVVRHRTQQAAAFDLPAPVSWFVRVGALVCVIQFAVLLAAAFRLPLGWDGLMNFEFKARMAFEHGVRGQVPLAYWSDTTLAWSHPTYPLLLPAVEFWLYAWMGRVDQVAIKIVFPLFFAAIVAFVCGIVRRLTDAPTAMATGIAMGVIPAIAVGPGAVTGYADVPMAAAAIGAVSCTLLAFTERNPCGFVLAGLLSGLAAWTKTEGLLLAIYLGSAAIAATIWMQRRGTGARLTWRRAGAALWIPLALILPWIVFKHYWGMAEADFASIASGPAMSHLDRLPVALRYEADQLLRPGRWGLIWPAFAVALGMAAWRRHLAVWNTVLAGAVVVPIAAYTLVYLFSSWPNWTDHVATSFNRLLTPLAPLALVFTACYSRNLLTAESSGAQL